MANYAPVKTTLSKANPLKAPPGRGSPAIINFPGRARVQRALQQTSEGAIQRACPECDAKEGLEENPGIQPKLEVGPANDRFEQEADQTAERVMRMADPGIFKSQISPGNHQVQAKGAPGGGVPSKVANSIKGLRGGGTPLPKSSKAFFEPRFDQDFSKVRLHTDAKAAGMADSIQAKAFTLGNDIAFAKGAYNPESKSGKRLLAHELTHTVQQGGVRNQAPAIRRQEKKPAKAKAKPATEVKLELSTKPNARACLAFVHNDEESAKKIAKAMHTHCAYNFISVVGSSGREVKVPQINGTIDPNSLFPEKIAKECLADIDGCRKVAKAKKPTAKKGKIEEYVLKQFFVAAFDCSEGFTLPVVALHNNSISDTTHKKGDFKSKDKKTGKKQFYEKPGYINELKKKAKDDYQALLGRLRVDVDKRTKGRVKGSLTKKELKALLKKEFPKMDAESLYTASGTTNIFRWCVADDLIRCHIGDPERPDHVVWTTNPADFEKLRLKNINVVLQKPQGKSSTSGASAAGESEGDLSTLFLILKKLIIIAEGSNPALLKALENADTFTDMMVIFSRFSRKAQQRIDALRYVNIETPGRAPANKKNPDRDVAKFEFILKVLEPLGMDFCDDVAEKNVKKDLKK